MDKAHLLVLRHQSIRLHRTLHSRDGSSGTPLEITQEGHGFVKIKLGRLQPICRSWETRLVGVQVDCGGVQQCLPEDCGHRPLIGCHASSVSMHGLHRGRFVLICNSIIATG